MKKDCDVKQKAYHTNLDMIHEKLTEEVIFNQLEEECGELISALAKWRRVLDGSNPSPVTHGDARQSVIEEIGDVYTCLLATHLLPDAEQIARYKAERWVKRVFRNRIQSQSQTEGGGT